MDNITLLGMAASGKSSLGKMLADNLNYEFVDVDSIIESYGKSLPELIRNNGKDAFLEAEEKALLSLEGKHNIFSPGGSCIYSANGMKHLKSISYIIFIDVPFELIEARLRKKGTAEILYPSEMTLKELYKSRMPLYKKYADITIKLDKISKDENYLLLKKALDGYLVDKKLK